MRVLLHVMAPDVLLWATVGSAVVLYVRQPLAHLHGAVTAMDALLEACCVYWNGQQRLTLLNVACGENSSPSSQCFTHSYIYLQTMSKSGQEGYLGLLIGEEPSKQHLTAASAHFMHLDLQVPCQLLVSAGSSSKKQESLERQEDKTLQCFDF